MNTQPPTVDVSPTQLCDAVMPTAADAEVYELHEHDEEEVLLSSDDEEVAIKAACAASQLCRDPIMLQGETLQPKVLKHSVMESHLKVAPFGRCQIPCWHR